MSEDEQGSAEEFGRALVRFNSHILGVTIGVIASAGLWLATLVLLLYESEHPGPLLGQLRYFFPGYSVSITGAFVGALWAGGAGYIVGAFFARAYGPWLLGEATRVIEGRSAVDEPSRGVALLRPLPLAVIVGALLALGLLGTTGWLSLRDASSGLNTPLEHYLPGYTSDLMGSLVGAFWVFLYGFVVAGIVANVYNRVVLARKRLS
jgi:hypothetical protein